MIFSVGDDVKRVEEYVKAPLTDTERIEYGEELSALCVELEQLKEQKSAASKRYGAQVKDKQTEISEVSRLLRDGFEMRTMEVLMRADFDEGKVFYYHPETHEVLKERPVTDEERQRGLFVDAEVDAEFSDEESETETAEVTEEQEA